MNKEILAFKLFLLGIAVVLTAIWLGSAAHTWPKANELTEVHSLPYPFYIPLKSLKTICYHAT